MLLKILMQLLFVLPRGAARVADGGQDPALRVDDDDDDSAAGKAPLCAMSFVALLAVCEGSLCLLFKLLMPLLFPGLPLGLWMQLLFAAS